MTDLEQELIIMVKRLLAGLIEVSPHITQLEKEDKYRSVQRREKIGLEFVVLDAKALISMVEKQK